MPLRTRTIPHRRTILKSLISIVEPVTIISTYLVQIQPQTLPVALVLVAL
jgi:hypothetical protein